MIDIRTLEGIPFAQLADTFNRAFSSYFVPIHMTEALIRDKMQTEQSNLAFSAGAFYHAQLVGMLLQGVGEYGGKYCAYNGGTGVFPEFRGQNITMQMYEFLLPKLRDQGVKSCLLEVIQENTAAIHIYEKIGFRVIRHFDCFRGQLKSAQQPLPSNLKIQVNPTELPWHLFQTFNNTQPSWPYTLLAAQRTIHRLSSVVIYLEKECVAFGLINAATGRICQFGVHPAYRRQGIGHHLFHHINRLTNRGLSMLNIDSTDQETIGFLQHIGFEKYIGQYEMEWAI